MRALTNLLCSTVTAVEFWSFSLYVLIVLHSMYNVNSLFLLVVSIGVCENSLKLPSTDQPGRKVWNLD